MATPQREREEKEEEEAEAEEFLYERRVLDGQERFWSQKSQVRLRILATEENIKNSPEGQNWNPRYLVEAKAELERRKEAEEKEEERRMRKEELKERIRQSREDVKERLRRSQGKGSARPQLKKTEP